MLNVSAFSWDAKSEGIYAIRQWLYQWQTAALPTMLRHNLVSDFSAIPNK